MFRAWVHGMNSSNMQIFLVDIGAMLWVIWLSLNDVVFNKVTISSSMQVIFRAPIGQELEQISKKNQRGGCDELDVV
jgi:hypothetical protein